MDEITNTKELAPRINVDWLKDPEFEEKYYVNGIIGNSYFSLSLWTDEQEIIDANLADFGKFRLELNRYFCPKHARWLNDEAHKELERHLKWPGD